MLKIACTTHTGLVRDLNEDTVYARMRDPELGSPLAVLVVADGMGGHEAGDVASKMAVETIADRLGYMVDRHATEDTQVIDPNPDARIQRMSQRLTMAIEAANLKIYEYGQAQGVNLGTTVSAVLIDNDALIVANVGDSRMYVWQEGILEQVSEDHSYVAHLVKAGELAPEEIYDHPQRSAITRALGHDGEVNVDLFVRRWGSGDKVLVCSDGLWEMVRDEGVLERVIGGDSDVGSKVDALIQAANERGGGDNIGVAMAEMG